MTYRKRVVVERLFGVLANYPIGKVLHVEPLNGGNTSVVYKVISSEGHWVLRSLKDIQQGEVEYSLSEHINKSGAIVPEIICTKRGKSFFIMKQVFITCKPRRKNQ